MKTMRMRLASWLMIVCILIGVFASSVSVQAADTTWDEIVDGCQFGLTTVKYMLTSTFGFFTQDLDTYMKNNDKYWQYAKDFQARWDGKEEGQTEIEVTKEELQGLYDIAKDSLPALEGYYLLAPSINKSEILTKLQTLEGKTSHYEAVFQALSSECGFCFYQNTTSGVPIIYIASFDPADVLVIDGNITHTTSVVETYGKLYVYTYPSTSYKYINVSNFVENNAFFCSTSLNSNTFFPYFDVDYTIYQYYGYYGTPTKVFYSYADYTNYINCTDPNSYQNSNFNMPVLSGNTLNIDLGKVSETDWDKVSKQISDAIKESMDSSGGWSGLTETDKQEIIDSVSKEILDNIDIGGGEGPGGGDEPGGNDYSSLLSSIKDILKAMQKTLEDIYMDSGDTAWKNAVSGHLKDIVAALTNISSSSKISAEHLFDIKGKVQVLHDKFSNFSFQTLIDTIKDVSGGGGGSGTVVGSTIGTVIGSLISDLIDKIQNGEETVEDAVADLTGKFSNLADTSKTKFPFSLPWDVILIFSSLAAEPETPVFDYPFEIKSVGFRYDIHMDLKDFEKMSQLTRSFFAITFAFLLVKLTLLMINRGDFD